MKPPKPAWMPLAEAYAQVCEQFGVEPAVHALRNALADGEIRWRSQYTFRDSPREIHGPKKEREASLWEPEEIGWSENWMRPVDPKVEVPIVAYYPTTTGHQAPVLEGMSEHEITYVEIEINRKNFHDWIAKAPIDAVADGSLKSKRKSYIAVTTGSVETTPTPAQLSIPASDAEIRKAIKDVYDIAEAESKKPPNINQLASVVQPLLEANGHYASTRHIQELGGEPEYQRRRRRPGKTVRSERRNQEK